MTQSLSLLSAGSPLFLSSQLQLPLPSFLPLTAAPPATLPVIHSAFDQILSTTIFPLPPPPLGLLAPIIPPASIQLLHPLNPLNSMVPLIPMSLLTAPKPPVPLMSMRIETPAPLQMQRAMQQIHPHPYQYNNDQGDRGVLSRDNTRWPRENWQGRRSHGGRSGRPQVQERRVGHVIRQVKYVRTVTTHEEEEEVESEKDNSDQTTTTLSESP